MQPPIKERLKLKDILIGLTKKSKEIQGFEDSIRHGDKDSRIIKSIFEF